MEVQTTMSVPKCTFFISFLIFVFEPAVSIAQISWVKNFDEALKQAAAEKKCVVLDLSLST